MTTIVTEGPYNTYMVVELTSIWTHPCSPIIPFEYFDTTTCAPPQYESVWYDGGYYSPAICPSGYTSGCEPTKTMKAGQTGAICVPSGWNCSSFQMHAFTVDGGKTTSAPAFQIRWEEDDLSLLETNPLTPAAVETGDPKNIPGDDRPRSTSAPPSDGDVGEGGGRDTSIDDNDGGGGLPTGAVVGIAVGVALLVAIVLIAGFLWYRKRYLKARRAEELVGGEKPSAGTEKPFNPEGAPPLYPDVPQEMEGSTKVVPGELPSYGPRMSPVEGQTSKVHVYDHTVQQLDGFPVSRPMPPGVSQHHTPASNAPMPTELHSSTKTMPTELGSWSHLGSATYPAEIDGARQVSGLLPQKGLGELHATSVTSELQASTARQTALGRNGSG